MTTDNFQVKDSGERINYQSGMRRDTQKGKPNYRLIDSGFLKRLAEHLTKGAEKYGRDNWRLANSQEELDRFQDSAFRHLMQWLNGETDEDHGMAVAFNIMAAENTKEKIGKVKAKKDDMISRWEPIISLWRGEDRPDKNDAKDFFTFLGNEMNKDPRITPDIDLYRILKDLKKLVIGTPLISVDLRHEGEILVFTFLWPTYQCKHMIHYYEFSMSAGPNAAIASMASTVNSQYLDKKYAEESRRNCTPYNER